MENFKIRKTFDERIKEAKQKQKEQELKEKGISLSQFVLDNEEEFRKLKKESMNGFIEMPNINIDEIEIKYNELKTSYEQYKIDVRGYLKEYDEMKFKYNDLFFKFKRLENEHEKLKKRLDNMITNSEDENFKPSNNYINFEN